MKVGAIFMTNLLYGLPPNSAVLMPGTGTLGMMIYILDEIIEIKILVLVSVV
jgi:uncharacterized RDD family membrane protein YckC